MQKYVSQRLVARQDSEGTALITIDSSLKTTSIICIKEEGIVIRVYESQRERDKR